MDTPDRTLSELQWIAYMSQQLGWHGLAKRIARDANNLKTKNVQKLSPEYRQPDWFSVCTNDGPESSEHALEGWQLDSEKDQKDSSTDDCDEENDSSFDRLKNLNRSWCEAKRDHALLLDYSPEEELWQSVFDRNSPKKPN